MDCQVVERKVPDDGPLESDGIHHAIVKQLRILWNANSVCDMATLKSLRFLVNIGKENLKLQRN